ncbi:MAG: 2',3'-cyclic-nucleotide 2'-phosphodiesterase (5'-nucleotidase family) [Woeseiaceae bacterium]|jgi:2',3'-cyclic-nucleotide 2'-phosphodiesterase (5'-nucleotidase family)
MRKSRRYWVLLVFFAAGCAATADAPDTPASGITFIHLNDTYRIDAVEEGRRGGFGRVASIVRELQAEGREVRILHGGDFLYPSLESQLWAGEQMVEALNFLDQLAPLYAVPGNHEFDPRNPQSLIDRVRQSEFDWLADNMRFVTEAADVNSSLQRAFTFTSGGKKIGIFALTLHPDDGGNVRDFTQFQSGYVALAEGVISQLEAEGADLIFGVTHLHMADDTEIAALKERHPNFMFIVGGHEHEPEYLAGSANNAAVMKGASNARTVWRVDVDFDSDQLRMNEARIEVDVSIPIDEQYLQLSDRWRAKLLALMPFLETRVGEASEPLDGREVTVRNAESNWANFIADQMRGAFGNPPADFAFINSGTLRIDDFIAEDITFEDIGRTFGFSSFLRVMTINGADFRNLLESGYRGSGPSKGYFPQISGFRVCIDRSRPEGQRIVQMQVPVDDGWQEIDKHRDYSLIAPDFIYRGGDGYDFREARNVSRPGSELKYLVLDGIIRAQAVGGTVGTAVNPQVTRIAFLQSGQARCF